MADSSPVALITGVTGQDGVYLSRHLLAEGYRVVGTASPGGASIQAMAPYLVGVEVRELDVIDRQGFASMLEDCRPTEIYNLAAFSSVGASWGSAELVGEVNGMAVLRILEELVRYRERHGKVARFYQASTSEVFGAADQQPQNENTPHHPRSPYAAAKSFAHHLTVNYRESYGLFACSGLLYNHESPLRGGQFVTRKITRGVAEIALGLRESLTLGNLDVRRDWGAAEDYVRSMRLMLAQDEPSDFIIASGVCRSLSELLSVAFAAAGLGDGMQYVRQDPKLMRPADVAELRGDSTKAREGIGWAPTVTFEAVIEHMVHADMARLTSGIEEDPAYLDARLPGPVGRPE